MDCRLIFQTESGLLGLLGRSRGGITDGPPQALAHRFREQEPPEAGISGLNDIPGQPRCVIQAHAKNGKGCLPNAESRDIDSGDIRFARRYAQGSCFII
jgi:hypothetical protein